VFKCLAVQPGLSHQLVVESHDLGQIEVAAPSDDIDADGPDEESSSGLIGVVFHVPLLLVEGTPGYVATSAEQGQR